MTTEQLLHAIDSTIEKIKSGAIKLPLTIGDLTFNTDAEVLETLESLKQKIK